MRKKKILFLIPNLKHGGAEKVLVNLVNNLDSEKYDITVQTLFDVGVHKKNLKSHITYKTFFRKEFRGNSYLFKCFSPDFWWRIIVKDNYDIAVSYLEGPTTRILSGCKAKRTKTVAWIHIELNSKKLAAQGFRTVSEAKKSYEKFDGIIAVSENVKKCFLGNINIKHPVEVLYNTIETETIRKNALIPVENEQFKTGDIPTICSVAKLMKTKGFDRLLEVHKQLLQEGLLHRVYILGIGEEQVYLERQIKKYHVEDTFLLLGFHENPYHYVANCDMYVCSSRREGFSTAVTEALVLGVPVVSTDCSGAKELLGQNNEYGIVVENSTRGLYDGIKYILSNPTRLTYYKKCAAIRGDFFSREKTVKAVEALFEKI